MLKKSEIMDYQLFAERTVKRAGEIVKSFKETCHIKKTKDSLSLDIATDADFASETYIVNQIRRRYPTHSIMTEETQEYHKTSDFEWIIDPLDGTKEFIRHIPYYFVLLALEYKGSLVCGVGYQPELHRLFSCSIGNTPLVNGRMVTVSHEGSLTKSFIYVSLPKKQTQKEELERYIEVIKKLTGQTYRVRNTAWDVEAFFNVASGAAEGFITPTSSSSPCPKWWDIAPGILMVESAGGKVSDFQGKSIQNRDISHGLTASNGKVHEDLLKLCHYLII
jgi:myo-inositol-1(or 4)-monophosphatase